MKSYQSSNLMIVTKNQSLDDVLELLSKGFKLFGENKVQEAKSKYLALDTSKEHYKLHLIGPLQRNKVKLALKVFDAIQTVDRFSLVDEISKYLTKLPEIKTKEFYIQVNIGGEDQKFGVSKENLKDLYDYSIEKKIFVKGLMCIPPNITDPSDFFKQMVDIRDNIDSNLNLSMGMSNDYKIALNFQANIIRIGSLIFQ